MLNCSSCIDPPFPALQALKTDTEGRYCLNDLHMAAGREPKHKPAEWLRYSTAKELVEELKVENLALSPLAAKLGRNGGTFVVKELVYAYAMWISPAFHFKVIRAYDTLQTQGIASTRPAGCAVADHAADDFLANPLAYFERVLTQAPGHGRFSSPSTVQLSANLQRPW